MKTNPALNSRPPCLALLALALGLAWQTWSVQPAQAEVITDGTVGPVQTLNGFIELPQTLGTVVGNNLFHSFNRFDLTQDETAYFTTTAANLAHVIARVTGGTASKINGTLALLPATGSRPDFYFINPAGVTFGAHSMVDVPAAFHVSTAQRLIFADGSAWDTSQAQVSTLSAAPPQAFGFLDSAPAASVTFNNRDLTTGQLSLGDCTSDCVHSLTMNDGAYVDIVAGNIQFEDTDLYPADYGDFRLVAVGSQGATIPTTGEVNATLTGSLAMQNSTLSPESQSQASNIAVYAGDVNLGYEGELYIFNIGDWAGGEIIVKASRSITLGEGAEINAVARSTGKAPDVRIQAASLTADGSFNLNNPEKTTGIYSESNESSSGASGNVTVNVSGNISLQGGAIISTTSNGIGNAGNINISAENITLDRQGQTGEYSKTGIFSDTNSMNPTAGDAGNITVVASDTLTLQNGAAISSKTDGIGLGGKVTANTRNLTIDGLASVGLFTGITSQANYGSQGNAGRVEVIAQESLLIREAGAITSDTYGTGRAGEVVVNTGNLTIDSAGSNYFTGISSEATNSSSGQTGNVNVTAAKHITLVNQGQLSIRSTATVTDPNLLEMSRLTVTTPYLELADHGAITAAATGNTNASQILIEAGNLTIDNAAVSTASHDGNGGPITLNIGDLGQLRDARITTSVDGNNGNGGDITLNAAYFLMQTGFIQANTSAPLASGGEINLGVQNLLPSAASLEVGGGQIRDFQPGVFGRNIIQAAAPFGVNGDIALATPQLDLSGALVSLNAGLVDYRSLLTPACQTVPGSAVSVQHRGGLPTSSLGPLRPEYKPGSH